MRQAADRRAAHRRIGTVVGGRWRLERFLGSGSLATVYGARDPAGRAAAIKILRLELARFAEVCRQFNRVALVAERIDHSGMVSVLGHGLTDDGAPFVALELLDGTTLEAMLRQGGSRPHAAETVDYVDQLLDTLAVAHEKEVLHLDLRPARLFVTGEGRVKVLGFSRAHPDHGAAWPAHDDFAAPEYMAPEQARGEFDKLDARTDLWGVGALLYACLSRRRVHEADTIAETLSMRRYLPPPPIALVMPGLSPSLAHVVERALALDPRDRYSNAAAMQLALRDAAASGPLLWSDVARDRSDPVPTPAASHLADAVPDEAMRERLREPRGKLGALLRHLTLRG